MMQIILISLITITCFSQAPPGIYFSSEPSRKGNCEQEVKMLIGKTKVCISKKPIIGVEEIEYVSDILYNPQLKVNYIQVRLSSSGAGTLAKIYRAMPSSQFVLVMEDWGIGRFIVEQEVQTREMRIGMDLDFKTLKLVQELIKKNITIKEQ